MNNLSQYMKITDKDGNTIPWGKNEFPDGQLQFKVDKKYVPLNEEGCFDPVDIIVSVPNPAMLDLFNQAKYMLPIKSLKVNYFYGARSDKGESGDYRVTNVASMFFENMFMDLKSTKITFLAPHCEIYEFNNIKTIFDLPDCVNLDDYDLVVFPDESARKRFNKITKESVTCEKHRDQESGSIVSHVIPALPEGVKKVLVLDDICDGGATYRSLAESMPSSIRADLFVFHGVFSNNALSKMLDMYLNVIVSNSLPNTQVLSVGQKSRVKVFDVWN